MTMRLAAAALVLSASTVQAQSTGLERVALTSFAASASADWVTTYRLIRVGGGELNPAINWLEHRPAAMVALGAGIDVAGTVAWYRVTRNHKKLRVVGLVAATGFRVWLAARNHRLRAGLASY